MAENTKKEFTEEVNSRLGEFFGDKDLSGTTSAQVTPEKSKASELVGLKAIVLSIEWEITDQTMDQLIAETDRLITIYSDNKIVLALLKLLSSIGKYINVKKVNAHPDSIKLLHSVHSNLQELGASGTLTEAQSSKILSGEVAKFKKLKQQLALKAQAPTKTDQKSALKTDDAPFKKEPMSTGPQPSTARPQVNAAPRGLSTTAAAPGAQDAVLHAINDLKELIRKELYDLREELKLLRQ